MDGTLFSVSVLMANTNRKMENCTSYNFNLALKKKQQQKKEFDLSISNLGFSLVIIDIVEFNQ